MKRKSVFKKLFLRIILLMFLFNIVLSGFHVSEALKTRNQHSKAQQNHLTNEINRLHKNREEVFKTFENLFDKNIKLAVSGIKRISNETDLKTADLKKSLFFNAFDTLSFDVYIINDSMVVNSTCMNDPDRYSNVFNGLNSAGYVSQQDDTGYSRFPWICDSANREWTTAGLFQGRDSSYMIMVEFRSPYAYEIMSMYEGQLMKIALEYGNTRVYQNGSRKFETDSVKIGDINGFNLHDSLRSDAISRNMGLPNQSIKDVNAQLLGYGAEDSVAKGALLNSLSPVTMNGKGDQKMIFEIIKKQLVVFFVFLILLSLVYLLTTRKFRFVLKELDSKANRMTHGDFKGSTQFSGENELTGLAKHLDKIAGQLEISQHELKEKKAEIEKARLLMQESRAEFDAQSEEIKAQKDEIEAQRDEIEAQRDMVVGQKDKILQQKLSITSSIEYASRIQRAILPPDDVINYLLPKHFVLFKPRDIVSGDFYWLKHKNGEIILVVADCTGHGVPGAFMSMLGSSVLNDIINKSKVLKANHILNDLRENIMLSLRQTGQRNESKDGMDISLCIINIEKMHLQYAGAYNPLYLVRNGELNEIKADRMPIGISSHAAKSFTNHELEIQKDDAVYLFTDGYPDQFGGEKDGKFMTKRFKQLLIDIQDNIMFDQKEILDQKIEAWMAYKGIAERAEQVDDITVMGVKI